MIKKFYIIAFEILLNPDLPQILEMIKLSYDFLCLIFPELPSIL